jgi:murein DD-endopeptidase MepM/ murein hydrolase activator NlpD
MSDTFLTNPMGQVTPDLLIHSENRLEGSVRAAQSVSGEKQKSELKKVAQEFEAIFIAQMLKVMRETIEESGLMDGGFGKSIYTELFDQEVSVSLARRGALGISDILYRNLSGDVISDDKKSTLPEIGKPISTFPDSSENTLKESEIFKDSGNEVSDLQLPVVAPLSSGFGLRTDPFTHHAKFHKGVDFAAPRGMRVFAALPGKVISAGYQSGYGNTVLIQHAGGIQTRYGHLDEVNVAVGDRVASESVLGTVGDSGRSTRPHLHFEVIRMGHPMNPTLSFKSQVPVLDPHPGNAKMGG